MPRPTRTRTWAGMARAPRRVLPGPPVTPTSAADDQTPESEGWGEPEANILVKDKRFSITAPWHAADSFTQRDEYYAWDRDPAANIADFHPLLAFGGFTDPCGRRQLGPAVRRATAAVVDRLVPPQEPDLLHELRALRGHVGPRRLQGRADGGDRLGRREAPGPRVPRSRGARGPRPRPGARPSGGSDSMCARRRDSARGRRRCASAPPPSGSKSSESPEAACASWSTSGGVARALSACG